MRKYEIIVLVDSDISECQVPDLIEEHLRVITAGGGAVDNVDHWGHRRLAYDINKKSETSYTVMQVICDPALVQELDRLMGIDERIVRTKVLRLEK